jgi:hypothetical protein
MFVGRAIELKEIAGVLERTNVSLMGGHRIGKTSTTRRLTTALQVAEWTVWYFGLSAGKGLCQT